MPAVIADDEEPQKVDTHLVSVTVKVTDREGRHVEGLDRSAFTVYDDKTPQEVSFFSDDDAPVSLAVVFDMSGSMKGGKLERASEALARFAETGHGADEYFLVTVGNRPRLLLDGTRDIGAVLDKFTNAQADGQTAMFDAAYLGVEKLTRGSHPRRAVLLISDGMDNNSRRSLKELRRLAQESGVILYAVGVIDNYYGNARVGRRYLEELAATSGGKAFFPGGSAEMYEAFERIALELRHQYSVGFRPTDFKGRGEWHRLKVELNPPHKARGLVVRSRDGYYAAARPRQ